jgi:hypothetical protein
MAMYPYMTLADDTEVVHSGLISKGEQKSVEIYFERPKPYGFDSARISLPSYKWITRDGFTNEEIKEFEDYSARHAHTIFHFAETGGIPIAKVV